MRGVRRRAGARCFVCVWGGSLCEGRAGQGRAAPSSAHACRRGSRSRRGAIFRSRRGAVLPCYCLCGAREQNGAGTRAATPRPRRVPLRLRRRPGNEFDARRRLPPLPVCRDVAPGPNPIGRTRRGASRKRAEPLAGMLLPPNVPAGAGAPDCHGELCFPLKLGHPPMSSAAVYSLAIKAMEEASGLTSWTADAAASERESAAAICLV